MNTYDYGDRVKVITENSKYTGNTGVITNFGPDNTLLIRLDEGGESGFFGHEVEMVSSQKEYSQIIHIAEALHKSGRYDDVPWVEIKADAASLYRAGCRFDG
jgi:hypothetical protein